MSSNVSDLKSGFNTFFDERTGGLLLNLRKANPQYNALRLKVNEQKEKLHGELDEATWQKVNELFLSTRLQGDVEGQYLFSQGLTDCAILFAYLQGEILDRNFVEKNNSDL